MDSLEQRLQLRLDALEQEYTTGQQMLLDLDQRRDTLANRLLRISGAIQVLTEEVGLLDTDEPSGPGTDQTALRPTEHDESIGHEHDDGIGRTVPFPACHE